MGSPESARVSRWLIFNAPNGPLGVIHRGREYAENEIRKDFTTSERTAIAETIEAQKKAEAKERLKTSTGGKSPRPVANRPQAANRKSRDEAAKLAGFSSTTEYRRAKGVVQKGAPELVKAMDDGTVKPSVAAKLAELPKPAGEIPRRQGGVGEGEE